MVAKERSMRMVLGEVPPGPGVGAGSCGAVHQVSINSCARQPGSVTLPLSSFFLIHTYLLLSLSPLLLLDSRQAVTAEHKSRFLSSRNPVRDSPRQGFPRVPDSVFLSQSVPCYCWPFHPSVLTSPRTPDHLSHTRLP